MPASPCSLDPGFTFINLDLNYSADTLKIPTRSPSRSQETTPSGWWRACSRIHRRNEILGGQFTTLARVNLANASVTADIPGHSAWRHRRWTGNQRHLGAAVHFGLA